MGKNYYTHFLKIFKCDPPVLPIRYYFVIHPRKETNC